MKKIAIGNILIILLVIWMAALFISPGLRFLVNDLMASIPLVGSFFERFTEPLIEQFYTNSVVQSFYPSIIVTTLIVLLVSWNAIMRLLNQLGTYLAKLKMMRKSRREVRQHIDRHE